MYTHNLDPILINFGFFALRWYSIAYILGLLIGWWLGKKIIINKIQKFYNGLGIKEFDNYITYIIISIILGGRIGYIFFYNLSYYLQHPLNVFKIWEGGMSFHGGLIGIIIATFIFSKKYKIKSFILLDIIACVAPLGIMFGRIANFINAELIGKPTNANWGVVFKNKDLIPRHPSQLYEAFLEGALLFIILYFVILKNNYRAGVCSSLFLILYGFFRIISEQFREPDPQIGYVLSNVSMGSILSTIMVIAGIIFFIKLKKNAN